MFVPVIAYDPDLFADFVFVMSQLEVSSASQPYKKSSAETVAALPSMAVNTTDSLAFTFVRGTQMGNHRLADISALAFVGALSTQVQSAFATRTFNSSLAAYVPDVPPVSGEFATSMDIEVLYDNIVFSVQTGDLNLSDTKANNKPVAPVVS